MIPRFVCIAVILSLGGTSSGAGPVAELSLLSEGASPYQIVVPDTLPSPALTESLHETARLLRTAFQANGADVPVVPETRCDPAKPAIFSATRGLPGSTASIPPSSATGATSTGRWAGT